ncbi:MAG: sugar phosphate nucleotidyltransferase [Acidobacteriota bacterium]
MNYPGAKEEPRWAIVLSGGEGKRMQSLTQRWLGNNRPKQYCTFVGSRSMLEHTIDRAGSIVPPDRIVTVIGNGHRTYIDRNFNSKGRIIEQPQSRDTLPGVLLPASHISSTDPSATLLIFPSDHFIYPEEKFLEYAAQAASLAERLNNQIVLLATVPEYPEPEYGWIEPGDLISAAFGKPARAVRRFHEKPSKVAARRFYSRCWLCNTMVMAVKLHTLWSVAQKFFPELIRRFELIRDTLNSMRQIEEAQYQTPVLTRLYQNMPSVNISHDLLMKIPERIVTLRMEGVHWNDWGQPSRVVESLARIGKRPAFPLDYADEPVYA